MGKGVYGVQQIREFLENHMWTAILAVAGLILAVLILTVGFWKTVLILALPLY